MAEADSLPPRSRRDQMFRALLEPSIDRLDLTKIRVPPATPNSHHRSIDTGTAGFL